MEALQTAAVTPFLYTLSLWPGLLGGGRNSWLTPMSKSGKERSKDSVKRSSTSHPGALLTPWDLNGAGSTASRD